MAYVISTGGDYDLLSPSKETWKRLSRLKDSTGDPSYSEKVMSVIIETCTKPSHCLDPRGARAPKLIPPEMKWRDIAFLAQRCIELFSESWSAGPWNGSISDVYDCFVKHHEEEERQNGVSVPTKDELIEALNRPPTTPPGVDLFKVIDRKSLYPVCFLDGKFVRQPFKSMDEVRDWVRGEHDGFVNFFGPAARLLGTNTREARERQLKRIQTVLRDAYRWRDFFSGSLGKRPVIPESTEEAEDVIAAFIAEASADRNADSPHKNKKKLPQNSDLTKLANHLSRRDDGESETASATSFCNGDVKRAKSMLRQLRNYPDLKSLYKR